jgi:hypothetical protein
MTTSNVLAIVSLLVAKTEAADSTVSVDLLVQSLLRLGATREDVGRVIAQAA